MLVMFCGKGQFDAAYELTKEALSFIPDVQVVQCERENIAAMMPNTDVVIPLMTKITADELILGKKLKMVMQFGVGIEGIDLATASSLGIWVCKIKSDDCGNAQSCAEHAIFLALSALRDVNELRNSISNGKLGFPLGRTIFGANIAIIGFGGIGKQLLPRLIPFGGNITIVTHSKVENISTTDNVNFASFDSFTDEFNGFSNTIDILFLCCNQIPENIGMINNKFISRLKKGCVIVNVARGGLLNYPDVYEALQSGHLFGIGIDVYHTEPYPTPEIGDQFLLYPKVIATPHVAGVTEISYRSMARLVAENVQRLLRKEQPVGFVNQQTNNMRS